MRSRQRSLLRPALNVAIISAPSQRLSMENFGRAAIAMKSNNFVLAKIDVSTKRKYTEIDHVFHTAAQLMITVRATIVLDNVGDSTDF